MGGFSGWLMGRSLRAPEVRKRVTSIARLSEKTPARCAATAIQGACRQEAGLVPFICSAHGAALLRPDGQVDGIDAIAWRAAHHRQRRAP